METKDILQYVVEEIHTSIMATINEEGHPVTCAIDLMDCDDDSIYFLTATGKGFYNRLSQLPYVALTALKGADTMHSVAVSVSGQVRELGSELLPRLFEKNPYMYDIYPTEESRKALTVFQIYCGQGEWFSLQEERIEKQNFAFGGEQVKGEKYKVEEGCIGCGACQNACPRTCIQMDGGHAVIDPVTCICCGNCKKVCPAGAIIAGEM